MPRLLPIWIIKVTEMCSEKVSQIIYRGRQMKNVGTVDKVIRIILGLLLLSLFFLVEGGIKYISVIGIILLITVFINFCPLYSIVNINTRKRMKR